MTDDLPHLMMGIQGTVLLPQECESHMWRRQGARISHFRSQRNLWSALCFVSSDVPEHNLPSFWLTKAFTQIDFDGNGFIGVGELRYLLTVLGEEGAVSGGLGDAERSLSISLCWFTQLFHVVSSESFMVITCDHCGSIAPPVQVDRNRSSKRCCVGRDSSTWL